MKETPNYKMLSWELRFPDQLQYGGAVDCFESTHGYTKVIEDGQLKLTNYCGPDSKR